MRKNTKWLGALAMMTMCAFVFAACGGDDGSGSGNNSGGDGGNDDGITISKLAGTWQAISAQGTSEYSSNGSIDTKEIWGLDSLDVPALVTVSPNSTFVAYRPNYTEWGYYNGIEVPVAFTWKKGDMGILPNGDGTVLLIGNQIQLNDSYGSNYATSATITSLTDKRLIIKIKEGGDDISVTYGRDGDGANYFQYDYINKHPSLVGNWVLTECDEYGAPIGSIFTFNSNGTGYYGNGYSFTYSHEYTGEFSVNYDNGPRVKGMITVDGSEAYGHYITESGNQYYILLTKN